MKTIRIINGTLLAFIALNAFGGGYYAMSGAKDVPEEWLQGSPFTSYFLPGLFLFVIVGGTCAAAAIASFRGSGYARKLSFFSGLLLLSWIVAQVSVIGYVSWMQPAIFVSGAVILLLSRYLPKTFL